MPIYWTSWLQSVAVHPTSLYRRCLEPSPRVLIRYSLLQNLMLQAWVGQKCTPGMQASHCWNPYPSSPKLRSLQWWTISMNKLKHFESYLELWSKMQWLILSTYHRRCLDSRAHLISSIRAENRSSNTNPLSEQRFLIPLKSRRKNRWVLSQFHNTSYYPIQTLFSCKIDNKPTTFHLKNSTQNVESAENHDTEEEQEQDGEEN